MFLAFCYRRSAIIVCILEMGWAAAYGLCGNCIEVYIGC